MITAKELNNSLLDEIKQLEITEYQKKYVDMTFNEVEKIVQQHPNTKIFGIYRDMLIVGFACCLLDDDGDMNLLKFMIDYQFQGYGYGKIALEIVLKAIRSFATKGEIWLSVHPKNHAAIKLYEGNGFYQQQTPFDADDERFYKYSFAK